LSIVRIKKLPIFVVDTFFNNHRYFFMKSIATEIKWAIAFAVMTLLWMVMEKFGGFHSDRLEYHPIVSMFVAIPAILVYVLALQEKKRKDYGGTMSYKQGFISGLIITVIVTALSPLTQYITSVYITPEFFPNVIAMAVKEGKMTLQEANDYFNLKSYIIQGLMFAPVMGLLTTAIVAFFLKSKPKTEEA
jgi:4-amino-4-deoxy-L-arabinose transferase-like glycosyltransferase